MKRLIRVFNLALLLGVALAAVAYWILRAPEPPSLQAFINANVLTVNAQDDIVEAVLVEGQRIIAVGTTHEITRKIRAHRDRADVVVHDLAGKTLMPGFIDAHSHFPASGIYEFAADLNAPPIGNVNSIADLQSRLRDHHATQSGNEWILGFGYDDTQMAEGRHPLLSELDAISTRKPVFILHVSGHMGVANSVALRALDVDQDSAAPAGGEYGRDKNGVLNGLVLETAAMPFIKAATDFSTAELLRVVNRAAGEYAEQGLTTVQNGAATARDINGLWWASKLNMVPQRIVVWPLDGELEQAEIDDLRAKENARFAFGAVKVIADGSIQGYTAYLSEPYHVPPLKLPGNDSAQEYVGQPIHSRDSLKALVNEYYRLNQQVAIHGNGDAAIDDVLEAVSAAQAAHPGADRRTILVHAQMARKDQLEEMKRLGVIPSFFSAHTYYWGDRHRRLFIGTERAARISPARSAQRLDIPFTIHLDSPVVPMRPMRLIWAASTRESADGRVIGRRERISRAQAIRAMTINAAHQNFDEESLGSVEVGKLADLIVLDGNPLDEAQNLLDLRVLKTFVGGVEIYNRNVSAKR